MKHNDRGNIFLIFSSSNVKKRQNFQNLTGEKKHLRKPEQLKNII